jgi:hypothetical protein
LPLPALLDPLLAVVVVPVSAVLPEVVVVASATDAASPATL